MILIVFCIATDSVNKKTTVGYGLLLIDMGEDSSISLLAIDHQKQENNYWKAYQNFIPQDKHVQSKTETFTVEGYNSLFRHFLARLRRRKSKCYSKNADRLKEAVMMLMLKRNNQLSILY